MALLVDDGPISGIAKWLEEGADVLLPRELSRRTNTRLLGAFADIAGAGFGEA
jgi:hypothetical protein